MDISADLQELARCPVGLVSAGVKSILDIGRSAFHKHIFDPLLLKLFITLAELWNTLYVRAIGLQFFRCSIWTGNSWRSGCNIRRNTRFSCFLLTE